MKAVILAAGKGVRLKPFTLTKPKHMLSVGGAPLLEWTLRSFRDAGVDEILIVTHYLEETIKECFKDGSRLGLRLKYKHQENMLGTADGFRLAEEFVEGEEFIGIYGDLHVSRLTLESIIKAHKEGNTTMSIVPVDNPSRYGVVKICDDKIAEIVEKPAMGTEPSCLANAGIYIFTPEIFHWIRETGASVRGEYEITDSLRKMIEARRSIKAMILSPDEWLDVGLPWNLLDVNERIQSSIEPTIEGAVEKGALLYGPVKLAKGAKIRAGAYIEGPVSIGEDSDIGPNCYIRPATNIGKRVRIGNACEIKNSIIMDDTHVAHLSYIGDSIIGENCNLGAGTITANIRFDKQNIRVNIENIQVDSGRRKLGALIGDSVQTGVNVNIMPGVKIGPGAWVSPGLTVSRDIPTNKFLKA